MLETYWPSVNPIITEEAGTRGGTHSGIDLAANVGDPVIAPCAGQIIFTGGDGASAPIWLGSSWLYPNGEGLTIDLRRDDGSNLSGMFNRLGHLSGFAVNQGDWVAPGQLIGYAGNTGYSTGAHIHWETRWDRSWVGGNWVNPRLLNPQVFTPQSKPIIKPIIIPEEDIVNLYFEATNNSSPLASNGNVARIWAGERKLGGVTFSSVWERSPDGTTRRLYKQEWDGIKAAYAAAGRKIPVAKVGGNMIEQLIYGKRA